MKVRSARATKRKPFVLLLGRFEQEFCSKIIRFSFKLNPDAFYDAKLRVFCACTQLFEPSRDMDNHGDHESFYHWFSWRLELLHSQRC
jgi:hypothetical protein